MGCGGGGGAGGQPNFGNARILCAYGPPTRQPKPYLKRLASSLIPAVHTSAAQLLLNSGNTSSAACCSARNVNSTIIPLFFLIQIISLGEVPAYSSLLVVDCNVSQALHFVPFSASLDMLRWDIFRDGSCNPSPEEGRGLDLRVPHEAQEGQACA